MFYCDPCAAKKDWPETISQSHGECEVCGTVSLCNNCPSSRLPDPIN